MNIRKSSCRIGRIGNRIRIRKKSFRIHISDFRASCQRSPLLYIFFTEKFDFMFITVHSRIPDVKMASLKNSLQASQYMYTSGGSRVVDPDPVRLASFWRVRIGIYWKSVFRIWIRIHVFFGLPDPIVRGMDPDPSIIMQKWYEKPWILLFWDSFWLFNFEK